MTTTHPEDMKEPAHFLPKPRSIRPAAASPIPLYLFPYAYILEGSPTAYGKAPGCAASPNTYNHLEKLIEAAWEPWEDAKSGFSVSANDNLLQTPGTQTSVWTQLPWERSSTHSPKSNAAPGGTVKLRPPGRLCSFAQSCWIWG